MSTTVVGILVAILIGLIVYGTVRLIIWRRKNADLLKMGADLLDRVRKEGLDGDMDIRSVRNATSIYLPQIQEDFPEFSWEEQRERAYALLPAFLLAKSNHDLKLLPDYANGTLRELVKVSIDDDDAGGIRTFFDDVTVNDVAIAYYSHRAGCCTITLDASAGFRTWQEKDGQPYLGDRDQKRQACFSMELIYIQDPDKVADSDVMALGLTCPNCGGVVKTLGQKYCEYCGSGIVEFNIRVWKFGTIEQR